MPEQPGAMQQSRFDSWSDADLSIEAINSALRGTSIAVMLYGSRARGTARPDSDVDVLQLVLSAPGSYSSGRINITAYTPDHLAQLATSGSLFVCHLKDEGLIIQDDDGVLRGILSKYKEPRNYASLKGELAVIFGAIRAHDVADYERGASRLAVYAIRTAIYLRSREMGRLCFDMEKACIECGIPGLQDLLRSQEALPLRKLGNLGLDILQIEVPDGMPEDFPSSAVWARDHAPMAAALLEVAISGNSEIPYTSLTLPPW